MILWPDSNGEGEPLEEAWSEAARHAAAVARRMRRRVPRFQAKMKARDAFVAATPRHELNRMAGIFQKSFDRALSRSISTYSSRRIDRSMRRAADRSLVTGAFLYRIKYGS